MVLEGVGGLLQQVLRAVLPDNPLMQLIIENAPLSSPYSRSCSS